ncbi:MAG: hypothetical protein QGD88_12365 [Anaerolineae bacterium]|nr:hypothetical protein [Anaerolineae bacterium]
MGFPRTVLMVIIFTPNIFVVIEMEGLLFFVRFQRHLVESLFQDRFDTATVGRADQQPLSVRIVVA